MPTILRYKGYRFFFYSNEGDPREPLHVHARKGEAVAKFWLEPEPAVAESYGMTPPELRELLSVAVENRELIREHWNDYFGV